MMNECKCKDHLIRPTTPPSIVVVRDALSIPRHRSFLRLTGFNLKIPIYGSRYACVSFLRLSLSFVHLPAVRAGEALFRLVICYCKVRRLKEQFVIDCNDDKK